MSGPNTSRKTVHARELLEAEMYPT